MPYLLLIAAAAAWWLLRPEKYQGDTAKKGGGALPAPGATVTDGGRAYRVVGAARPDGLVPVSYQAPAGTLGAAVVQLYDPRLGRIVSASALGAMTNAPTVQPPDVM